MSEVPFRATITEDGNVSLPDNVREGLDLEPGDVVTASIMLGSGDAPDTANE